MVVRNQRPLDPASLDLEPGATVDEYIACLNSRVYFWPGTMSGPLEDGLRMFHHAGRAPSTLIRVPSRSLIRANPEAAIHVSTCNTGAAWMEGGQKSRRGPQVFQPAGCFPGAAADIAEISFTGPVCLPRSTRYAPRPGGPWRPLFHD